MGDHKKPDHKFHKIERVVQIEQIIQGEILKKHTKDDLTIFLGKDLILKMIKARGLRIGTTLDPYLKKKIEQ